VEKALGFWGEARARNSQTGLCVQRRSIDTCLVLGKVACVSRRKGRRKKMHSSLARRVVVLNIVP